jgi:hypothetical protein
MFPSGRFLMAEGIIQFEVEITDMARIRSRVSWPDSSGPWIEGGLEDLMVHFAYACWIAYRLGHAVSLALASGDDQLGQAVSSMLSKTIEAMGAVQMAEIRMNRQAMDDLRKGGTTP